MNILDQSTVFIDDSSFNLPKNKESVGQMVRNIAAIAVPVIIGQFFSLFVELINVAYIGHLNDPAKVAGVGLGNMYVNIFCLSIVFGLNGAITTLAAQAHGSGNDRKAGVYLNRGRLIIGLAFIPIISILLCCEKFLIMINQDPTSAKYAQTYAYGLIPAMIFQSQFDATRNFLNAMHKTKIPMIINVVTSCLHFAWCYLLVMIAGMDIVGAALAMTITYFTNFIAITIYCVQDKDLNKSFFFPGAETFRELGDYLRIGIPSASMLCLEWWSLEVLALMAGYISVVATASFVIIVNSFCALGMFAFGAGIAASVCIGKAAGEGDHHKAKQYAKMIVLMTFVMVIIIALFVYQSRSILALIFTSEENILKTVTEAFKFLSATLILHGLGLVQGGVLRGLGLQSQGSKVVLFSFYVVSLPSAYLYAIHMELGVNGLIFGITSGSFSLALLNFIILKCISWRKITRDIQNRMREVHSNSHTGHTLMHLSGNHSRLQNQLHHNTSGSFINQSASFIPAGPQQQHSNYYVQPIIVEQVDEDFEDQTQATMSINATDNSMQNDQKDIMNATNDSKRQKKMDIKEPLIGSPKQNE